MLKKISLIALILIGGTGAYALVSNLYPDVAPGFPRIPMQSGTIGEAIGRLLGTTDLANYAGDGTVSNTLMLSGVSASGYVQGMNCTNPGEVWKSIDANGVPQCGLKGALLVFGTLTDTGSVGNVTITHADNSNEIGYIGMPLKVGDIVTTVVGGSASIGFSTDNSILRLDGDTIVELRFGTLGGNSVAEAILNDGALWGRVLTSTGINFGAGGYIAGVRGTSIALTKSGADITMTVPHSIQATDAVLITNANTPIINTYQTGPLARFTFSSGSADNPGGKVTTKTLSYLYEYDHWIRENTKKDILALTLAPYVYGGMTLPTTDEATRQATVKAELEATVPKVLAECNELLKGGAITFNANTVLDQVEANAITPAGTIIPLRPTEELSFVSAGTLSNSPCADIVSDTSNKPLIAKKTRCGLENKTYWPMYDARPIARCQDNDLIAIADLTQSSTLHMRSGKELEARLEVMSNDTDNLGNQVLLDNGQYENWMNDQLHNTDWRTFNGNASQLTSSMWYAILNEMPAGGLDCPEIHKNTWVQGVYIKNRTSSLPMGEKGSVDNCENPNINRFGKNNIWYLSGIITPGPNGMEITQNGQYLTYPINSLGNIAGFTGGSLKNRTVTIELGNPAGTLISNATAGTKFYVADFGSSTDKFFVWKNKNCNNTTSTQNWLCKSGTTTNISDATNSNILIISGIVSPTQMAIGNAPTFSNQNPIGTTIKKITIE